MKRFATTIILTLVAVACSSEHTGGGQQRAQRGTSNDATSPVDDQPGEEPTEGEDAGVPREDAPPVADAREDAPASVPAFRWIATGGAHTCALTASGAAYCWGRGESGQLGVPVPTTTCPVGPCSKEPVAVTGGRTFGSLVGGGAHTCGKTNDGSVYCWGNNSNGQLGDGTTTNRSEPVLVAGGIKFERLNAGASHTCGLTADGVAYCWGRNDFGQLGDGTTTDRHVPVRVVTDKRFGRIEAGGFDRSHTCALIVDSESSPGGEPYCWGANDLGQLGRGSQDLDAHPLPAPVSGGHVFVGISAGLGRHTCALTLAGAAWCWGEDAFGALGTGAATGNSKVPVAVSGGLAFSGIVAGGFIGHTCGITKFPSVPAGATYCWGDNEVGAVGDGTTIDRFSPTAVVGGQRFIMFDAGFRHTCGLTQQGIVYCWGSNGAAQLGNRSTTNSPLPVKLLGQP